LPILKGTLKFNSRAVFFNRGSAESQGSTEFSIDYIADLA